MIFHAILLVRVWLTYLLEFQQTDVCHSRAVTLLSVNCEVFTI